MDRPSESVTRELDATTLTSCLEVWIKLKEEFKQMFGLVFHLEARASSSSSTICGIEVSIYNVLNRHNGVKGPWILKPTLP